MGSQGKNTEVVCHSLLQWTTFCQNSTMTRLSWVALQGMAHSFIELGKAVVHVISLVETEVKVKVIQSLKFLSTLK